jgi:hypothetical protein|nr:hypothetical protein [Mitsuokella multacida]DAE59518.1 MAG TPA: hemolysin [Caudoviricetes sp.]
MNDRDFWISLSTKIARIDERTQQIQDELKGLPEMRDRLTAVEQRAKSNTHRLDGLKTTAALIGTLASVLINIIAVAVKAKVGG